MALLVLAAGCQRQSDGAKERVAPNPNAPAAYPVVTTAPSSQIARARPPSRDASWKAAPFWVLHTELSPAILVHSSTRYLGLFSDLPETGLGAPAHVAWSTRDGPRAQNAGSTHDVSAMEENWLLVWFAGSAGWTNWDAPWAVFLQRKPSWLRLDEKGLHLEFPESAGDVVLIPLYGYFKLPPAGRDYLAEHGLPSRKVLSWQWEKSLARDPLTRLRYWAGATRELPIYCEENFSVDLGRDEVTLRWRFERHSIEDDWKTRHVKLAPLSPPLGLAAKDKTFPVRFSKPFFDMGIPTPFGPYVAVQGEDQFAATFPWLHYVNESAAPAAGAAANPPWSPIPGWWSSFGRPGPWPLGEEAARCAAMARLAYKSGDIDGYNYAAFQFVRELTLLWDRQRGAEYFRKQQPWHSMEWMDEEVFVANLQMLGWSLDGPNYPAQAPHRYIVSRWYGFADGDISRFYDIARFYRDWLREDVRRELNWRQQQGFATNALASGAHARSLLLDEPPTRFARLVPPGPPSPFVAGAEREVPGPMTTLLTDLLVDRGGRPATNAWPRLAWLTWKSPAGDGWNFGRMKPVREGEPKSVRRIPLNWNTEVITFTVP